MATQSIEPLKELQELEITLREAGIVHQSGHGEANALRERIAELRQNIDKHLLARYDRLAQHGPAVVEVVQGLCMGCNLSIPQGDLNRMINGKNDKCCPNCGAFVNV